MLMIRLLAALTLTVSLSLARPDNIPNQNYSRQSNSGDDGAPQIREIVNAASLSSGAFAPGTLIAIEGMGFSHTTVSAVDDGVHSLPLKLAGVEVRLNHVALPLLSIAPSELRAQLPYDLDNLLQAVISVRIEHSDGSVVISNSMTIPIASASPGIFAFAGAEPRSGLVVHADSQGHAGAPVTNESPAQPGQVIVLWATGLGMIDTTEAATPVAGVPFPGPDAPVIIPVEAMVGGRQAQVLSATLPAGSIGVYEIRVRLPHDLPTNAATELFIAQNGYPSNSVTFPVVH
jgi:uncharacterized protein (TIGR03437 family)